MSENQAPAVSRETVAEKKKAIGVQKNPDLKNIVLGPNGKPCRACSDFKSWSKQMKGGSTTDLKSRDKEIVSEDSKDGPNLRIPGHFFLFH